MYYKISQLVAFTSFTLICLVHLVSLENKFPDLSLFVGETVHLGFDALLFSAFLAGVKRTTGLTYASCASHGGLLLTHFRPSLSQVPNKDIRRE